MRFAAMVWSCRSMVSATSWPGWPSWPGSWLVLMIVPLFENLKPILTTVPEVDDSKVDPGELAGEIEVAHVSFQIGRAHV